MTINPFFYEIRNNLGSMNYTQSLINTDLSIQNDKNHILKLTKKSVRDEESIDLFDNF